MNDRTDEQGRKSTGAFTQDLNSIDLDAEAVRLYASKHTYREIAAILDISVGSAYQRVQRAKEKAIVPAATEAVQQIITNLYAERSELETLRNSLRDEYERGRLIADPSDPDGDAIPDPEYRLKVADRMLKVSAQLADIDAHIRKLLGLDRPTQSQVETNVTYNIIGLENTAE